MSNVLGLPLENVDALATIGKAIFNSHMTGAQNPAEGFGVALILHQERISLLQFTEKYHMMQGRTSKKAEAMLADLHRIGGKHTVKSRTPEKAEIEIEYKGAKATYSYTWEEAKLEPATYNLKTREVAPELAKAKPFATAQVKTKYATPRSRMQMLWARVISDGVRASCPEATGGCYTPEETADIIEADAPQSAPVQAPVPISQETAAKGLQEQVKATTEAKAKAKPAPVFERAEQIKAEEKKKAEEKPKPEQEKPEQPKEDTALEPAYDICPTGPAKLIGMKWSDMKTEHLESALGSKKPQITEQHKAVIKRILNERKEG